jgi:hypothetical protein
MISPLRVVMLSGGMLAAVPTTSSPRERIASSVGETVLLEPEVDPPVCAQAVSRTMASRASTRSPVQDARSFIEDLLGNRLRSRVGAASRRRITPG